MIVHSSYVFHSEIGKKKREEMEYKDHENYPHNTASVADCVWRPLYVHFRVPVLRRAVLRRLALFAGSLCRYRSFRHVSQELAQKRSCDGTLYGYGDTSFHHHIRLRLPPRAPVAAVAERAQVRSDDTGI